MLCTATMTMAASFHIQQFEYCENVLASTLWIWLNVCFRRSHLCQLSTFV